VDQSTGHFIHMDPVYVAPIYIVFFGRALFPRQQMDLCTPLTSANSPTHSIFRRIQGCAFHYALHHAFHHALHHAFHHTLRLCTPYSRPQDVASEKDNGFGALMRFSISIGCTCLGLITLDISSLAARSDIANKSHNYDNHYFLRILFRGALEVEYSK
jgi:hypothetical protein